MGGVVGDTPAIQTIGNRMMETVLLAVDPAPTPAQFNAAWIVPSFLASIAANIATVILVSRKQKNDVTIDPGVTTKEEFLRHVEENKIEHVRFDARIGGVDRKSKEHADLSVERLRAERREDMRILHTEINDVGKKVASLDTETQNQNAWLSRIYEKLDGMRPSRTAGI